MAQTADIRVTSYVTPNERDQLAAAARFEHRSVSAAVRLAIARYVEDVLAGGPDGAGGENVLATGPHPWA